MCDQINKILEENFIGKFGFLSANEDCFNECKDNPFIIPKLYRYIGMGHYQILANVKDVIDGFFFFEVGGANGYEAEENRNSLNKLTPKKTYSLEQIKQIILKDSWCTISSQEEFDGGVINTVTEHFPNEVIN